MSPRGRSALLWGVVGLLTFFVLVQGYLLAVGPLPLGTLPLAAVGVVLATVVAGVAYASEQRLATKGRS